MPSVRSWRSSFYHLPAGLIFGFAGNGLLRAALEKQGYLKSQDLEAQSPEDALAKAASKSTKRSTAPASDQQSDLSTQITRLNELRRQGALSDAEYQAAKDKLLA
ncbi:MAG: SHOCT domain-containing protein [Betaproteobacteria bacterium]|nr:SHOCT domain-containing protein [Betaproteobacteria bacterium]